MTRDRTGRGRQPAREMTQADVVGLLHRFESAGVGVWVDGGWGVDALMGDQLRAHDDLDIVVGIDDVATVQDVLRRAGYTVRDREAPLSFMTVDDDGRQVDVHPVSFDESGNGLYQMDDGDSWTYPATGLAGTGSIGGTRVRCLTPELQMRVHAGYELEAKDHAGIRILHERFGVGPPPGYEWPDAH
jgi:lincosamide nucleotidyltransferase A/C/D/E